MKRKSKKSLRSPVKKAVLGESKSVEMLSLEEKNAKLKKCWEEISPILNKYGIKLTAKVQLSL